MAGVGLFILANLGGTAGATALVPVIGGKGFFICRAVGAANGSVKEDVMIESAIRKISEGQNLTQDEAFSAVSEIVGGLASDVQIAAFLVGLRVKGESVAEIAGGVRSLLAAAVRIAPQVDSCVDIVGTGGDCTGTFNISSAAALTAASAGACVAKHGNRSVSSQSGSADVYEALGLDLNLTPGQARRCLETCGFTFLFAPVYHPAMRHAAPVRRQLGIRSLFNLLGPLANPAGADRMLVGVNDARLLMFMTETLRELGVVRALVVRGRDGTDEISLAGDTDYCELDHGNITSGVLTPEQFGLASASLDTVRGGTPPQNARMIEGILGGVQGPARDIVLLNAGATLYIAGQAGSITQGIENARLAIDSGAALDKLQELRRFSRDQKAGEAQ